MSSTSTTWTVDRDLSGAFYSTGTVCQIANFIFGSGTTFTAAMVGGSLIFDDGTDAGIIKTFSTNTVILVSTNQTVGSPANPSDYRSYRIYYPLTTTWTVDSETDAAPSSTTTWTVDSNTDASPTSTTTWTVDSNTDASSTSTTTWTVDSNTDASSTSTTTWTNDSNTT